MILLYITITVLTIYAVLVRRGKNRNLPPGPIGIPVLGYLPFLNPSAPYVTLTTLQKKYGSIYGLKLGSVYTVVLCDANLIRDTLKRDIFTGRAPLYVTHGIMGGYGLICSEGELWKDQRKLSIEWIRKLGGAKHSSNRQHMELQIITGVNEFIKMIAIESTTNKKIDPTKALVHTLGNVVNMIVFGVSYAVDDPTWLYLQQLQEEGVRYVGISGVVNFIPWLRYLPSNKNILNFLLSGKLKTHQIYDEIIEKMEKQVASVTDGTSPTTFLTYFLNERLKRIRTGDSKVEFCNRNQFKHLLADMFGASVDTTVTTLRWFFLYMAKSKVIQCRIREELFTMTQNDKTGCLLKHYENSVYLRASISETQRIRSVVPLGIPHSTTEDTVLSGYNIPKNTMVLPLQWAVHMNEACWTNPDLFDPSHFIDSDGKYTVPHSFLPFQTGKRMCIGEEFAKMLLYLYSGHIIQNFEIDLDDAVDLNGECGITLTPAQHYLTFRKLDESE